MWTVVTDAWGYSDYLFKNDPDIAPYLYGYISRVLWVLPAIFLILKYSDQLKFEKKELFSRPVLGKSFLLTITLSLA